MRLDEDLQVEVWRRASFARMGFDGGSILTLQAWGVDLHDAESLLYRDGKRTSCTHDEALRILQPVDDVAILLPRKCIVCDGYGCWNCPKS